MRRPVAAKTAFDTAAAVTAVPGSPIPPGASRLRTRCTSMAGVSLIRMTRTSWKLDCSTRPFLSVTPPHRAPLIPKTIPLSIWAFTVSGFTTVPQSTAQTTRWTRTSPAFDTETPAFGQRLSPSGRLRGDVEDCHRARRFAEKGPAKRGRILLRGGGELVDEALDHEVVVCDSDASPEPG